MDQNYLLPRCFRKLFDTYSYLHISRPRREDLNPPLWRTNIIKNFISTIMTSLESLTFSWDSLITILYLLSKTHFFASFFLFTGDEREEDVSRVLILRFMDLEYRL